MNPFRTLDDFLIDRVFQKIADGLHRFASCYAIGSFLLVGFALLHFAYWGLAVVDHGGFVVWFGIAISILWIPSAVRRALILDRQWSEGRDVLPAERIERWIFRLLLVAGTPLDFTMFYDDWHGGRMVVAATDLAWTLCMAGFYFLACTPKRPRRQTAGQLAWSASR